MSLMYTLHCQELSPFEIYLRLMQLNLWVSDRVHLQRMKGVGCVGARVSILVGCQEGQEGQSRVGRVWVRVRILGMSQLKS